MSGAGRKLTIRLPDNVRLRGATVGRVHLDPGMRVAEGSPVLTLLVRGREHKVRAPKPGRIVPLVAPGDPVTPGDPLYILNIDEEALVQSKRTERALVPADNPKWSKGVTPELIEPLVRSRQVGPEPLSAFGQFASVWGKPVFAIALYVLACFALLPILRAFGHDASWPVLLVLCSGALLFAGLINNLYSSVSGWFARWTVHLVAASWVLVSGLAIFGPPEIGETVSLTNARDGALALFSPSKDKSDSLLGTAPEKAPDTGLQAVSDVAQDTRLTDALNSSAEPGVVEEPVIARAVILPPTTAGVGRGKPLGAPVPFNVPPKSVLPGDVAIDVPAHGVAVRTWARVQPSNKPGRELAAVHPGEPPLVQKVVTTATRGPELAAMDEPETVSPNMETVLILAAGGASIPTPVRTYTEQPLQPSLALAPDVNPLSMGVVRSDPAAGASEGTFASAKWSGSGLPELSLANLNQVSNIVVLEGEQAFGAPPPELALLVGADPVAPKSLPGLATLDPARAAPEPFDARRIAGSWLSDNGIPVPEAPSAAQLPGKDLPLLVGAELTRPVLAGLPVLLAGVADADPMAYRSMRSGENNWMLAQTETLVPQIAAPNVTASDLRSGVDRSDVDLLIAPEYAGTLPAFVKIELGPVLAALSPGIAQSEPDVLSDTARVVVGELGQSASGLADVFEPGPLELALAAVASPRIPTPEPAFDEKLLLFLYYDDPRAESHPGVGDDWAPQVSEGLVGAIRAAKVEAVREVVQVSAWCSAADDPVSADRTAWLNDRIRLLQVRIAVEPTKVAALEEELPIFGDAAPGFFHNFRPLLGGSTDAPVMARAWDYLQSAGAARAAYFDKADVLAGALTDAGCTEAAWDGEGPANAIGRAVAERFVR
ncbi:MAG: hypothetical protein AB8B85_08465 [Paracoccaceae bacterium]